MSLARQFASNVISQGLARLLSIGANLLLLLVVARAQGAEAFGHFSYVLAFAAIAVTFADLGTTAILSQGLVHHEGGQRSRYLGNFLLMRGALLLPVMAGAVVAVVLLHRDEHGALLVAAMGLPVLASRFFEPVYQVYGKPWLSLWSNLVFGGSQLLLAATVWWFPRLPVDLLMLGHVFSNLLYTATALGLMWRLAPPDFRPERSMLGEILALAAPIGVGAIFSTLMMRLDVLLLEHLRNTTEVGHYSAAFRLVDLAVFVAVTVVTPFITILSKDIAEDSGMALQRARQFAQAAGLFSLPVALSVPLVASDLVAAVWGPAFAPAAEALQVLVLNVVIVFFSIICYSINVASRKVSHAFWVSPLATLVSLLLNLWWIPRHGIVAAAWVSVLSQGLVLVIAQAYVHKDFGNLYDGPAWRRLALACGVLWLVQQALAWWLGPWVGAVGGLLAYGLLAWRLRLMPAMVVDAIRARRARAAAGP